MKKFFLLISLFQILGCNPSERDSAKNNVTNKTSQFLENSGEVKKIREDIASFYKGVETVQYRFNGDSTKPVVSYVVGKTLIIPITPSRLQDSDYLSIGVMIDLETKAETVFVDGLQLNYSEFKEIINKANEWAAKTVDFNAKHILEIPVKDKIAIQFPQSKEPRDFKAVMIFSEGVRNRDLLLREIGTTENPVNISFKREHLMHLAEGLSELYVTGAINESSSQIQKEIADIKTQYDDLKIILK
ncbi:MAG: hypothetical protein ACRDAT_06740 [Cetobacterium sp.]